MKLVTFNLRCDTATEDGKNHFNFRRAGIVSRIRQEAPEAIGFQEMTGSMLAYLEDALPEYLFLGCGRDEGFTGEHNAIAIFKAGMVAHALDTFWLSDTPNVPGSKPLGAGCTRVCTYARLYDKREKKLFFLFNTHLDHVLPEARTLGLSMIAARITRERAQWDIPAFLMGDFNFNPGDADAQYLHTPDFPMLDLTGDITETFDGFGMYPPGKIDYILADRETAKRAHSVRLWASAPGALPLSDHSPVELSIEL